MIKSDFASGFSAEAIAAFQRQFHLGVETLDNAAGILFGGLEIVEKKAAVRPEGSSDFLERGEAGSGDFGAPSIQKLSGPSRGCVGPEVLESFHEEESAQGAKGGTFQICLLYTSPSPRDRQKSRMPSSA